MPESGVPRRDVSTVAGRAGGPARSSAEALVMEVERRSRAVRGCCSLGQPVVAGRSYVDELKASGKSFQISKREVWDAWLKVRGNKGAPGIDGVGLAEFEKDLKDNLYRVWNRMSSGTYFPPPVMAVEIPKPHGGGTRVLGVPTVADRIAQTVAARPGWKRWWNRCSIPIPMGIGRGAAHWTRWGPAGVAAGSLTG